MTHPSWLGGAIAALALAFPGGALGQPGLGVGRGELGGGEQTLDRSGETDGAFRAGWSQLRPPIKGHF